MTTKILLVVAIVMILFLMAALRMAGICSREEEREWEDG